jgi:hypothetical protein
LASEREGAVNLEADLWWLPPDVVLGSILVGVGHTEPLGDHDDLGALFQSFGQGGLPSTRAKAYTLAQVGRWREAWYDENVYRSLRLFDLAGRPALLGPFYLDFDADDAPDGTPDLEEAELAARRSIELLRAEGTDERDFKVWFTGHKGFNVEVRPDAVGVGDGASWAGVYADVLAKLRRYGVPQGVATPGINYVSPTVCLDRIFDERNPSQPGHTHLRVVGSKNVWLASDGTKRWRVKREVSLDELFKRTAREIAGKVES